MKKDMRFTDIKLSELDLGDGFIGSISNFICEATDELISVANKMRERLGYTDLVEVNSENDVYYNFYLCFNTDLNEIKLQFYCHHGEKDDYAEYDIPLFPEEEKMLMFKIIEALIKELEK